MQDTLAQAAVLWLPDVAGELRYLVKQRVLRKVAHYLCSLCCRCSLTIFSSSSRLTCNVSVRSA